jgi:hypothetical protein
VKPTRSDDTRARRFDALLPHEDVRGVPVERQLAGKRKIEQDPDAVPICLGPHAPERGLLGRHIGHGADEQVVRYRVAREVRHEPEVQKDSAISGRDQDVRRLDVAMDLVRCVQAGEASRELGQRSPEA